MIGWRVVHPNFTICIETHNGRVSRTPPLARWATGRSWDTVRKRFEKMGATIEFLGPLQSVKR